MIDSNSQHISLRGNGNGKRHRTPSPVRPRKIKRITFETFSSIKELVAGLVQPKEKAYRQHHHNLPTAQMRSTIATPAQAHDSYEPSNISNTRNSLFWQWRRVAEWHHYINDPYENKSGHMTT